MTNKPIYFKFDRSTKNTHKFNECDASGNLIDQKAGIHVIGSLYVQQKDLGAVPPGMITVTIEVPNAKAPKRKAS